MIEFQGVSKVFAGHPAVKDLTLELREGAFSVLVGTSGSGKSSLINEILYKTLACELNGARSRAGKCDGVVIFLPQS